MKSLMTRYAPLGVAAGFAVTLAVFTAPALKSAAPKFFNDDPLQSEPATQDAANVKPWDIDLVVDLTLNQFGKPGDATKNVRAQNVNSIDEVPDGAWFTNRAGHVTLTADDVATGPDTTTGPAAGKWTVTSSKSDGITPGFTIKDARGDRWFIKFDPPKYRGMATGTEVAVTKLFWALGYHVPENHIARMTRDQLEIDAKATYTPPGRKKRAMKVSDLDYLLSKAQDETDGSYRVIASKSLPGHVLGGFRFYGTRPDDPNDTVPHEHRRELRGYRVFAAWFNHVDAKAINSLDTLVKDEKGRSIVRHHLLDFGSTLGSGGVWPREGWEGYEYLVEGKMTRKQMVTFGFSPSPWRKMEFYEHPAVGRMPKDNASWRPDDWKPRVPNAAFLRARDDDKFWAATKAAAITDAMVRAAVKTGQFGDEGAEQFLSRAIIERRDAILRTYLVAINPITSPTLAGDGRLTFNNAAVDAKVARQPASYRADWQTLDNATGATRQIGETKTASGAETSMQAPAGLPRENGAFVKVRINAMGGADKSWEKPVDVYFHRSSEGWKLVGLERMPEGNPPAPAPAAQLTSSRPS
jgi:hypothetical protein